VNKGDFDDSLLKTETVNKGEFALYSIVKKIVNIGLIYMKFLHTADACL